MATDFNGGTGENGDSTYSPKEESSVPDLSSTHLLQKIWAQELPLPEPEPELEPEPEPEPQEINGRFQIFGHCGPMIHNSTPRHGCEFKTMQMNITMQEDNHYAGASYQPYLLPMDTRVDAESRPRWQPQTGHTVDAFATLCALLIILYTDVRSFFRQFR